MFLFNHLNLFFEKQKGKNYQEQPITGLMAFASRKFCTTITILGSSFTHLQTND